MEPSSREERVGVLTKIVGSDTLLAIFVPAAAYIFTYFYKLFYFLHFEVDYAFISIGISDLLFSAALLIAFTVSLFGLSTITILPSGIFTWIVAILIAHLPPLLFIANFVFRMASSGKTWINGILLIVAIAATAIETFILISHFRRGGNYVTYLNTEIEAEDRRSASRVGWKIMEAIGAGAYFSGYVIPLLCILAAAAGSFQAAHQRSFLVYSRDERTFVLVGNYNDGIVFAEVQVVMEERATLTDPPNIMWVSSDDLSGVPLERGFYQDGIADTSSIN